MKIDEILYNALKESLKLQSHYAILLNKYDGGQRMTFDSVEHWLKRLREINDRKKETHL